MDGFSRRLHFKYIYNYYYIHIYTLYSSNITFKHKSRFDRIVSFLYPRVFSCLLDGYSLFGIHFYEFLNKVLSLLTHALPELIIDYVYSLNCVAYDLIRELRVEGKEPYNE
jgi:hypothetical protein